MENSRCAEKHLSLPFPLDVLLNVLAVLRALTKQHEPSFNGETLWVLREYAERRKHDKGEQ